MRTEQESIGSSLIGLLHGGKPRGLEAVALCAEAIAADARFNLWVGTIAKQQTTEEHMIELVDLYDRLTSACLLAVEVFEARGDSAMLERSIQSLARQLLEARALPSGA